MLFVLLALFSALLFGAAAPFSKLILPSYNTFQLAGILYLGAAFGVLPFTFRGSMHGLRWSKNRKNLLRLAIAIICGGIFAPLFLLKGLQATSAASVSLWLPLELVATAILGVMFFADHLGRKGWLGMIGIVFGSILLSINEPAAGPKSGIYILAACLFWGIDNNLMSLIDNISPAKSTFWKGLIAGTINLSIGLLIGPFDVTMLRILAALLVGACSYGASIALYITVSQNIGASRAQMFFATGPFFGVAISAILLGESVSWIQLIAAAIILLALGLVYFEKHFHQHVHDSVKHNHGHRHDDSHHNHKHDEQPRSMLHSHFHKHEKLQHSHPHWPDLHHRHNH
jgi:drug/metabolite transporter (DMT)-like permease